MARARNIKPGFFTNDVLAQCSPCARLVFAGLWTIADREGRLEDRPLRIRAQVMPYDNCEMDRLLDELAEHNFIIRYENSGHKFIQITNFRKHQNPHVKEPASTIPEPDKNCYGPADSLLLIPSSTTSSPSPEVLEPDSMEAVAADLVALGSEAGAARSSVESAGRVGSKPAKLRQVIEFWKVSGTKWGIGALVRRISNDTPKTPPHMGWPEIARDPPETVVARARNDRLLAQHRESEATKIIKANLGKKTEEETRAELAARGLEWPA